MTFFAGIGHLIIGHVDLDLLMNLLVGSVPGVLLGAYFSSRLPQNILRMALTMALLAIGGGMLMGEFKS